ncbi:MAG: ATPase with chaperone activity [Burkholderiales bacterium RIFOXYC12_FULL_65_23]|uniref:ATPase with chaperone activity n=1 Tax=Malikia spinosa TaxID=86180 RepID=UPI0008CEA3DA|nr:ATPase with chaperone activity [Malikia spinosa]OGB69389.1 MAG: ATPase with chaperone activity [Burkholderiales bacterium RIFOXYC12_FULL_65_23]
MQKTLAHGESQILLPESFVALFVPPGKTKPTEPYEVIAQRHELCEDMAQLLTEQAAQLQFKLGVHESDVLERMHAGLSSDESGLSAAEAGWVVKRLAELLDWSWPSWLEA